MASVVDIANHALLLVGSEPITLLTEDNTRARSCNTAWPIVRKDVLRSHSWNCATTRAELAPLTAAPLWQFDTAYLMPSDCLHVMEADTTGDWRVEGRNIVTDTTGTLFIRYLKDETDTEKYDGSLTNVMGLRLAVEICEKLTGNRLKRSHLMEAYMRFLNEARIDDGEEQSYTDFEEDDWVLARY